MEASSSAADDAGKKHRDLGNNQERRDDLDQVSQYAVDRRQPFAAGCRRTGRSRMADGIDLHRAYANLPEYFSR